MNGVENPEYKVAVNHEEQYSLWLYGKENAMGWRDAGLAGTKEQCLAYIRDAWTDMRPLSLRKSMMPDDAAAAKELHLPLNQIHRELAAAA